ncbi:MAG: UDP-N-acetylmuramoyl-L-alanyl-D-glutamate--2,6-diaminopimelate ligase [Geobacteraceae bacterium]|nr:UDP-N-acetylmuramoyl-L-alanyl-D-glutamate--2,6-diaminopimelate ligase [Geobacteraceae bacterium]
MKLSELLESIECGKIDGSCDPEITGIFYDSRKVEPGGLFFALKGVSVDGHGFIGAAVANGAVAVVFEDDVAIDSPIVTVRTADSRSAMAKVAAAFYGNPTAGMPLVGITGTNGKTTTTFLIEGILGKAGLQAAVLGTISYRFGDLQLESTHTTPESTDLQASLKTLADAGAKSFVMEVSSHALDQKRVDGCFFDVGIFSNLTRDHLDYHGSMDDYLKAKGRLFAELLKADSIKPLRRAAVNMDDPSGAAIRAMAACPVITFGTDPANDLHGVDIDISVNGISGIIQTPSGCFPFSSKLLGRFNLSNILAAVSAGVALNIPLAAIKAGIEGHLPVPGRMERVENDRGVICLVDYAHTGDALENVLSTIKEIATGKIISVFGCGGDRDNGKRPIMGGIAAKWSDLAIVTSDNPRTEDPFRILEQVKAGISGVREYSPDELGEGYSEKGFIVCENRREAIRLGARLAQPGDILLLAGKGHEDYQIIGKVKYHFDDREEAALALRG